MMRWFGRITSFRVIGPTLVLAAAAVIAVSSLVASGRASADPGDDPRTEPVPTVEAWASARSIAVRVLFNGPTDVQFLSGGVSQAPPPVRVGGPPLIKVEVFDVAGALVEEFNAWHPLWVEQEGEDGENEGFVAESGEGRFVFPFAPDIGAVTITDIQLDRELVEIDVNEIIVDYCAGNAGDPACESVPPAALGAMQLPDTGGTAPDGGPGSLPWLAAVAGALALMGAGGVTWLAYQRRRSR